MKINKTTKNHIDEIHALEILCFSCPRSKKALYEEVDNQLSTFITATSNNAVIGYAGMHLILGEGYIDNIAVLPDYRKKGVAKALIAKLKDYATEFLTLEVRVSNIAAINLYQSLDFELMGKRKNFYENPIEDGLIYTWRNNK